MSQLALSGQECPLHPEACNTEGVSDEVMHNGIDHDRVAQRGQTMLR